MNKKKKWVLLTVLILILTNLFSFYGGNIFSCYLPNGKVIVSRSDYNKLNDLNSMVSSNNDLSTMLKKFDGVLKYEKLFEIRKEIYDNYDGEINEDALLEGAIKGMTASLNDPYTVFMNKKEYDSLYTQTEGSYTGIGIEVGVKDNKIVVVSAFDDSPAKKAGILSGDIIQKINGTEVTGKELDKAVSMMRGTENTEVTITILRENRGNIDIKLKRQKISLNTVKGEMLNNNIGYIQISMFDENTGTNFNKKASELKNQQMKGLILDLRQNPGGLVSTCIEVASNFVPKGKVVVSLIDKNKNETRYNSKGGNLGNIPLVVLVDEGSASASEILCGAIRDYKIGTIIGKNTFGKGIVQSILDDKSDGTALKVTSAKYYTPNGENIHHVGIKPDVEVDYPDELKEKAYDRAKDPQFSKALEVINEKMR